MKKSTKLLSLALALGMTASMVACNDPTQGPGGGNYETGLQGELTVLAMDKGYGLVWLIIYLCIRAKTRKLNEKIGKA